MSKKLDYNPKGGKWRTGVWIKRVTPHANGEDSGYLTQGRSYQVMSPEKYYSNSKNFKNRYGRVREGVNTRLADDCVILRDDSGKYRLFGARNFVLTSKGK